MRSKSIVLCLFAAASLMACNESTKSTETETTSTAPVETSPQPGTQDDESAKNVVQVAIGSPDHTTLVKAVQAADLVNALSTTGPFTVFAPTNAAFEKLEPGTLENLLKPESKEALADILQYHVSLGVFKTEALQDGQVLGQVNGGNVTVSVKDGKVTIGGANIIASVPASNGIVHVIDGVLIPSK